MKPEKNRKTHRLKGFDYSSNGIYFVTICTHNRRKILSEIVGSGDLDAPKVKLLPCGEIAYNNIISMNKVYDNIFVKSFVIMPNHIHLLVEINRFDNGASGSPLPTNAKLSRYISAFKRYTNKEIGHSVWQRSFFDHIIRDENDYTEHLKYIEVNPQKWLEGKDKYL